MIGKLLLYTIPNLLSFVLGMVLLGSKMSPHPEVASMFILLVTFGLGVVLGELIFILAHRDIKGAEQEPIRGYKLRSVRRPHWGENE